MIGELDNLHGQGISSMYSKGGGGSDPSSSDDDDDEDISSS
jgi:hypothetical protein